MYYLDSLAAQMESQPFFHRLEDVNETDGHDVLEDLDCYEEEGLNDFDFETSDYIQSIDALASER